MAIHAWHLHDYTCYRREVLRIMWEFIQDAGPSMRRSRRNSGLSTLPAMLIGASVGIAAWEMAKKRNVAGNMAENVADMANVLQSPHNT